jgi:lipoprotein signal peptidase
MKKLVQIFQEDNGKFSSKRVWGGLIIMLCGIAFVVDGLHFYTVNNHLFDSFLTSGTVLIGVNVVSQFRTKKK